MDDKDYMKAEKARLQEKRRNEVALEKAAKENKDALEAQRAANRKKGLDGEMKSWK